MLPRLWLRNGWTQWHLIAAVGLVALGFFLTRQAWGDMLLIALNDEEASHVLLVPIIAAWLVWVRRDRFRHCYPTGQALGPVLVALGWAISSIGYFNAIQAFWHGGTVLVVIGCLLTAVGSDILRRFLPAFVILVFLVPVPASIRQPIALELQTHLAVITQEIFVLMGEQVGRDGNLLTINGEQVAIAEACNGLRMVFALVMVSFAFAFGTPLRPYVRVLIVGTSILSAMLCNIIRMIPTVWLFGARGESGFEWLVMTLLRWVYNAATFVGVLPPDTYEKQVEANLFHDMAGWIMLVLAFLILMGIIRVLRWALIPVTPYTLAAE